MKYLSPIDIGTNKITSLSAGTVNADAVNLGQIISYINASLSGTANTLAMFTGTNTIGNAPISTNGSQLTSTQSFRLPNGSAAIPAYSFTNATTTGLFLNSSNLGFSIGGVQRAVIHSSGALQLQPAQYGNLLIASESGSFNFANLTGTQNVILNLGSPNMTSAGYNTAVGISALPSLTIGTFNTAVGNGCGINITSGSFNTLYGYQAGAGITTQSGNHIFGTNLGTATGNNNVAFGYQIMNGITGNTNVGVGFYAGSASKVTERSIFVGSGDGLTGFDAQYSQIIGNFNQTGIINMYEVTAIGNNLLSQNYNTNYNNYSSNVHTVTSVSGQTMTVSPALPTSFVGKQIYVRANTGLPTGAPVNGTWYLNVITTTTLQMASWQGTISGTQTGGTFTRYVDDISNVSILGHYINPSQSNQVVLGNSSVNSISMSGHRYKFNLNETPSILTKGKWFSDINGDGVYTPTDILLAGNGNASIPSISFRNFSTTGLYADASNLMFSINGIKYLNISSTGIETNAIRLTTGAAANRILQSDASGNASWVTPSSIFTDTHIGSTDLTLTGNRILNSGGFSFSFTGNSPLFHLNSTTTNTTPNFRMTYGNGGTGNVYDITMAANNVYHSINSTSSNHVFRGNTTIYSYIGNTGISASSQASGYPAYNFIGASQTGLDGTSGLINMSISGIVRATLNSSSDFTITTNNNINELTSKLVLKTSTGVLNGFEQTDIFHSGTIGARYRTPASRSHIWEFASTEHMRLNETGLGLGTSSPSTKLHVVGGFRLVDGNQANGKVLVSDANGLATWQTFSSGVAGSGTLKTLPMWTPNGTTLGDSPVVWEGSISSMMDINATTLNIKKSTTGSVGLEFNNSNTTAGLSSHSSGIIYTNTGSNAAGSNINLRVANGGTISFTAGSLTRAQFQSDGVLNMQGYSITNIPTFGMSGSNVISAQQVDNNYEKKTLQGTINLTNPSLSAGDCYGQDITVSGAAVGDIVVVEQKNIVGTSGNVVSNSLILTGIVRSANTVQIQAKTPNGTWFANIGNTNFKVLKF